MSSPKKKSIFNRARNLLRKHFADEPMPVPSLEEGDPEGQWRKDSLIKPKTAPAFEPDKWSKEPFVSRNNCYSYALNHMSPYFVLEPGFIACVNEEISYKELLNFLDETYYTTPYEEFGALLTKYAEKDGLSFIGDMPKEKEGHYLVALYIRDGICDVARDYHWLRLDQDNQWSHKPGTTEVVRDVQIMFKENIGDITDPRDALYPDLNMPDSYTDFVGYFHVPIKGIDFDDAALHEIRKDLQEDMKWGRFMPPNPAFKP